MRVATDTIDARLDRLATQPFRARHDIPAGEALTTEQQACVVDVIVRWIGRELAAVSTPRPVG